MSSVRFLKPSVFLKRENLLLPFCFSSSRKSASLCNGIEHDLYSFENKKQMQRPLIGILGGVGPMAGTILHRKIISHTPDANTDQDHLEIVHLSLSSFMEDRTKYLYDNPHNNIENPGISMGKLALRISSMAYELNTSAVVCVACNTFHTKKIWDEFENIVTDNNNQLKFRNNFSSDIGQIKIIHMIECTLKYIQNKLKLKKVGLLSTTTTRQTGLYCDIAKNMGLEMVLVNEEYQNMMNNNIFNKEDGLKKLSYASKRVRNEFELFVHELKTKGAEVIVLGCTEIPMVFPYETTFCDLPLLDPMTAVALEKIEYVKENTYIKPTMEKLVIQYQSNDHKLKAAHE